MLQVTFKGAPLTLVGRELTVGALAPNFKVAGQDLQEITLRDFNDKIKVITTFPSLDTPVCDLQLKEFNRRALNLGEDIVVVCVSNDLPFAQKRFCVEADLKNLIVASDYKTSSFGMNYGLLIKELGLLSRSAMIIDKCNVIRYQQIAEEVTNALKFDEVFQTLEEMKAQPSEELKGLSEFHCVPCEGGIQPFDEEEVKKRGAGLQGWEVLENKMLEKVYKFKDFVSAKCFVDIVSAVAEEQQHHPDIAIKYNKVTISLATHAAHGLTGNDFIMAALLDQVNA